jgi:hypothetical protein
MRRVKAGRRCVALSGLGVGLALLLLSVTGTAGAQPGNGLGEGPHCTGSDAHPGPDNSPCDQVLTPPPPPPPPPSPSIPPVGRPTFTPPAAITPPPSVPVEEIQNVSYVLRRAFVAGQSVRVTGLAPNGCDPTLHLDGSLVGPIATSRDGAFDLSVATHDLPPGQHLAEVYCTNPAALLVRTQFWVAAPQSSSNLLFVVFSSLFVLYALGWVALRTVAGPAASRAPRRARD